MSTKLSIVDIHYDDEILLHHPGTEVYLHSHDIKYPLRYDDGRISSQGIFFTRRFFNLAKTRIQVNK